MVNYNNSKIYKIEAINGKPEDIYIGSTTLLLCKRMAMHRLNYKNDSNNYTSKILFEKYGIENCNIILIENVNVETKEELLQKEAFYIKSMKCVNKVIPLRTHQEYHQEHKIERNASNKARYLKNHEENKIKNNERHTLRRALDIKVQCECGKCYYKQRKSEHLKSVKHQKFINNII